MKLLSKLDKTYLKLIRFAKNTLTSWLWIAPIQLEITKTYGKSVQSGAKPQHKKVL
jgi:hypothetical protein